MEINSILVNFYTAIGFVVCVALCCSLCFLLISDAIAYIHTMRKRFSARKWYRLGREDEASGAPDYFKDQPKPSWRFRL